MPVVGGKHYPYTKAGKAAAKKAKTERKTVEASGAVAREFKKGPGGRRKVPVKNKVR